MVKGTNISVYVDSETLAWLDQVCGVLGTSRAKAITTLLKMIRDNALTIMRLAAADPTMVKIFRKMLKDSI